MPEHQVAEPMNCAETRDLLRKARDIAAGRAEPERNYPYLAPDYKLPFVHIGTQRQLFVDNHVLERLDGVRRTFPHPVHLDRPLVPLGDLPWEQCRNPIVHAARFDPQDRKFKLWYTENTRSAKGYGSDADRSVCYAESDDALAWHKPLSEKCQPYGDHKATNIVCRDAASVGIVMNEGHTHHSYRFLMVRCPYGQTAREGKPFMTTVSGSDDGLSWTVISEDSDRRHHHESGTIWDESLGRWVAYSQYSHHWDFLHRRRQIGRQESEDFIHWSPKEAVLSTEWDPNLPPNVELHDMSARKVGGLYLGIVTEFETDPIWRVHPGDGHNWCDHAHSRLGGLYSSRDGRRWHRVGGYEPWAPPPRTGPMAARHTAYSVTGAMCSGGRLIIPYVCYPEQQHFYRNPAQAGINAPEGAFERAQRQWEEHHQALPWVPREPHGSIGALLLREDGWAELAPESARGSVLTSQFVFEGDMLKLNADCHRGYIRVEILDPHFKPYPGFAAEQCVPVCSEDPRQVWHTVRWNGPSDLRSLWNKPCRLRIELNGASLYSLQFESSH